MKKMTLEQKCALLSGKSVFQTRAFPKQGIPAIWLSDGPQLPNLFVLQCVSLTVKYARFNMFYIIIYNI